PDLSPTSPHSAPKISGTDSASAPASSGVSGMRPVSAPAQVRNEKRKPTPKTTGNQMPILSRFTARNAATAAIAASTMPIATEVAIEDTVSGGMPNRSVPAANEKVVLLPAAPPNKIGRASCRERG